MKFKFLGTGGAIRIPKACCNCNICIEARQKGIPYKRLGQSLFLYNESILFDTPEDINEELNIHNISNVKNIFFSHWHPDHTLGCRIIEILNKNKLNPLNVYMPKENIEHFLNKQNPIFSYFENTGFCNIFKSNYPQNFNEITVSRIKLLNNFSYAFLITEKSKKVLYCPCHSNCIPIKKDFFDLDLLIMNLGTFQNNISSLETNFEADNIRIIKKLNPKKTIFTHIEESYNLNYNDCINLQSEYNNIIFAFDGMEYIV